MMKSRTDILNFRDAQQRLGVSRSTLLRWLKDGRLAGYKAGKKWKFHVEDLDGMLVRERETPYAAESGGAVLRKLRALGLADRRTAVDDLAGRFWCEWQDREQWHYLTVAWHGRDAWLGMRSFEPEALPARWTLSPDTARAIAEYWSAWDETAAETPARPGICRALRGATGEERRVLQLAAHVDCVPAWDTWLPKRAERAAVEKAAAAQADWYVLGPPHRATAASAYALLRCMVTHGDLAGDIIATREREPTYFRPSAIQIYGREDATEDIPGSYVMLAQIPEGTSFGARGIRSPRVRIGYILTSDAKNAGAPAGANILCVAVEKGRWKLKIGRLFDT